MKIQCDVCNKDEASVFCTADEAALCDACDHRVHHANKLASKHQRFSLLHPSSKQVPLCDVCQERRAFLFCQEDRAILCRDCDIPIHTANEHTQKHNRFLLTGVKLSATSTPYTSSSSAAAAAAAAASTNVCEPVPDHKSQPVIKNSVVASLAVSQPSLSAKNSASTTTPAAITDKGGEKLPMDQTSSISEYLIETLPGWHVEDFLDSTYDPFNFCKSDDGVLPFLAADIESNMGTFSPEISFGIWVPRSPAPLFPPHLAAQTALKEAKEGSNIKANRRWMDDGFTVPQITTPSTGSKRSRPSR
ncbi:B-box zinc finger protein 21-like [Corylus avellana]|uniref:B-box zinc finger protein 21-like n=1 Tax=Corylus avellana TaxID=13451 RepID=UPI00286CE941|nr:B-box zinc finger protein 21-like [Corylus avellana]